MFGNFSLISASIAGRVTTFTPVFYVVLKNYESTTLVKTRRYDEQVNEILTWYYGSYYQVIIVFSNPEYIYIRDYYMDYKETIMEEVNWRKTCYWWEEEGEELDSKIRLLESILV